MNPQSAAALWALNRLTSEQLPDIAYGWLEAGWDSLALRILAGERNPIMSQVGPVFETVLEELGIAVPTPGGAVAQLVSEVAQKIVEGTVSPCKGATDIEQLSWDYAEWEVENYAGRFEQLSLEYEESVHEMASECSKEQSLLLKKRLDAELDAKITEEARKLIV